jgi:hypothetical protein
METNIQEQFQTLYPSRRKNEDQLVSPEAAHRQQAIRFVHVNID